jgi:hypothetical protein
MRGRTLPDDGWREVVRNLGIFLQIYTTLALVDIIVKIKIS